MIAPITSRQNPSVKRAASLKQKKYRDEYGEYIVEGEKMVAEAFACGCEVVCVFAVVGYSFDKIAVPENKIVLVTQSVFAAISDEKTPQGILAIVKIPTATQYGGVKKAVILDGLQDPGNVGAILRIAAACGVDCVFAVDSADPYSPKAVRASMSGIFRTKVVKLTAESAYLAAKNSGLPIIIADMGGENVLQREGAERFCLVLGNEGNGISDFFKSRADEIVSVPMQNGIESLNVAVAAGVLLYSLLKQ